MEARYLVRNAFIIIVVTVRNDDLARLHYHLLILYFRDSRIIQVRLCAHARNLPVSISQPHVPYRVGIKANGVYHVQGAGGARVSFPFAFIFRHHAHHGKGW